jgi:hypothetical protein
VLDRCALRCAGPWVVAPVCIVAWRGAQLQIFSSSFAPLPRRERGVRAGGDGGAGGEGGEEGADREGRGGEEGKGKDGGGGNKDKGKKAGRDGGDGEVEVVDQDFVDEEFVAHNAIVLQGAPSQEHGSTVCVQHCVLLACCSVRRRIHAYVSSTVYCWHVVAYVASHCVAPCRSVFRLCLFV